MAEKRQHRTAQPARKRLPVRTRKAPPLRVARAGRMIALGSLVLLGALVVIGASAVALIATEPNKSSRRRHGWDISGLSNTAREKLNARVPERWRKVVREDMLPEVRDFVARQTRRI